MRQERCRQVALPAAAVVAVVAAAQAAVVAVAED